MSKITQEKKEEKAKLKGKQAKIAKSAAKNADDSNESKSVKMTGKCLNYGKCCTCTHFPHRKNHEAQVCNVSKKHVARKAEHPECYKCKFA